MALLRASAPTTRQYPGVARRPLLRAPAWVSAWSAALRQPVDPTRATIVVAAISLLGFVSTAFVPETAARDHTATEAAFEAAFVAVFSVGCLATWLGCVSGRRWGLFAALPVTLFMLISAVTCPLSGHHTFGTWVLGASGAALGAMLVNIAALRFVGPPRNE